MKPRKKTAKPKKSAPKKAVLKAKVGKPKVRIKLKPKVKVRVKVGKSVRKPTDRRKGIFKKFQAWLWSLGIFGSPLILAVVLWRAFSPTPLPEPVSVETPSAQVAPVAQAPPPQPESAFVQATKEIRGATTGERVAWWMDRLEQGQQLVSAEKAPAIEDTAPLWPPKFDCTTYVETVLALARTSDTPKFFDTLLAIRYHGGRHDFFGRNHFPEVDWIPNNAQAGIIRDVTREIASAGGREAATQKKVIRKQAWFQAQLKKGTVIRSLASQPDWSKDIEAELPYIRLDDVAIVAGKIATGTVINLVRKDSPRQPVMVTHQGFVVQQDGKTWIRHSTPEGHIRRDELVPYLERLRRMGKWPLLGVNLNAPV